MLLLRIALFFAAIVGFGIFMLTWYYYFGAIDTR